ncbi:MAG: hypothetical protein P4L22_02640 [Candidatus Babeliales bacterium]|nr:hypothetical protein [Candidatus Babeliales bacterium]
MKKLLGFLSMSAFLILCNGINAAEKEVAKTQYQIALQKIEEIKLKKEEVAREKHLVSLYRDLACKFQSLTFLEEKTKFYLFISKVSDAIKTPQNFTRLRALDKVSFKIEMDISVSDDILDPYLMILRTHINPTQFLAYNSKLIKSVEKEVLAGIKSKL